MSAKNFALMPRVFVCLALSHFSLNANLLDSSSQSNAKSSANYNSTNSTNPTTSLDSNDKNSNDVENDSLATQATQSAITQNQLQQNTQPRHPIITQILNRTQLYGHIGTFGKSSILGKEREILISRFTLAQISLMIFMPKTTIC